MAGQESSELRRWIFVRQSIIFPIYSIIVWIRIHNTDTDPIWFRIRIHNTRHGIILDTDIYGSSVAGWLLTLL